MNMLHVMVYIVPSVTDQEAAAKTLSSAFDHPLQIEWQESSRGLIGALIVEDDDAAERMIDRLQRLQIVAGVYAKGPARNA